jgi:hypothetical protein
LIDSKSDLLRLKIFETKYDFEIFDVRNNFTYRNFFRFKLYFELKIQRIFYELKSKKIDWKFL